MQLSGNPIDQLSAQNVTAMLRGTFGALTVDDIAITPIGTGQMANSYRISLSYSDAGCTAPRSIVAKVSSHDELSRQMAANAGLYLREVHFYRQLADLVATRAPHCYYADISADSMDFTLLLEDLGPAQTVEQLGGCTADQAALGLEQAAALHGSSWGLPAVMAQQWLSIESAWKRVGGAIPALTDEWLARFGDRLAPEHIAVVTRMGTAMDPWLATLTEHRCLSHGDFRLDNLLFGAQGGTVPIAVVDWQSLGISPGIIDVSFFLGTSLDADHRLACERDLVADYHQRLCAYGVAGYPLQRCWLEYQTHALYGLVLTLPVSLGVQRTERGDAMFAAMARRVAEQIIANDSFAALAALPAR